LAEACRKVLILEISRHCEVEKNKLLCMTLHPELEQQVAKGVRQTPQEISLVLDPVLARHIHEQIQKGAAEMSRRGNTPLLLISPAVRLGLKRFYAESFPHLLVIAYNEISPKYDIEPVYTIPAPGAVAAR
jgi:flagellar biosynthesis protein FlhA